MWTTTRTLAKKINKNREAIDIQLEEMIKNQNDKYEKTITQISNLYDKLEFFEKINKEYEKKHSDSYIEIIDQCEKTCKSVEVLQSDFTSQFQKINDISNSTSNEVKDLRIALQELATESNNQNKMVSDNIESMNIAIQEMLRNLLSLDEGNRLIIAKLLLGDMEI